MTVTLYRSTDTSAPTLSGTSGDLLTVLDKCLITGYGSKTNAGWSYTTGFTNPSGNVAMFKQGAGSNGYSFRINDSGARVGTTDEAAGTLSGKESRIRGYEAPNLLTDPTGAANPFPLIADSANGWFIRKSLTADATTRNWVVLADARTCHVFIQTTDVSAANWFGWSMGEYYSYKSADAGRTYLWARSAENSGTVGNDILDTLAENVGTTPAGSINGRSIARSVNQAVGGISLATISLLGEGACHVTNTVGLGVLNYTNSSDNKLYLAPIRIAQNTAANLGDFRGRIRGLWDFCHPIASAADGDTFSGTGDLAGKSFLVLKQTPNGGLWVLETSNTWDTN